MGATKTDPAGFEDFVLTTVNAANLDVHDSHDVDRMRGALRHSLPDLSASVRREAIDDVVEFLDGLHTQYADRAARAILRVPMSDTDRPFSDAALEAAERSRQQDDSTAEVLEAAHDRGELGLDASVHAGNYRREVIEEVRRRFLGGRAVVELGLEASREAANFLLREFASEAIGAADDQ